MLTAPAPGSHPSAQLRRIPPVMSGALIRRGEWSLCAMEHSRIGPIEIEAVGAPFHHLALPLERVPLKLSLKMDGHRLQQGRNTADSLTMIEAGAGGLSAWDGVFESACFYFTTESLGLALGFEVDADAHRIRTKAVFHAPAAVRLLHALHADAAAGQPHGALVGDAIFTALAGHLVSAGEHRRMARKLTSKSWRVRRALEFIHAHLTDTLTIAAIAANAATSPFYLNHVFRAELRCSIWQYVLRARARYALALMCDPQLSLASVAQSAGFETYASFIAATRREYGESPAQLRHAFTRK